MDIFLGSSRVLAELRTSFAALVDSLSGSSYDACGEDVIARMWETESYAMERDRSKQEAYDEMICGCDLAFFLVDEWLGDYTLHEYRVASGSFASKGSPRIVAWVRANAQQAAPCPSLPVAEDATDANLRVLLESASANPEVEVRHLDGENAVLLEMLEIIVGRLGPVPLSLHRNAVWTGHKRLVALEGVPTERVASFERWLANR